MPVIGYETSISRLDAATLEAWAAIPAAVASDCLGRAQAMAGAIGPAGQVHADRGPGPHGGLHGGRQQRAARRPWALPSRAK